MKIWTLALAAAGAVLVAVPQAEARPPFEYCVLPHDHHVMETMDETDDTCLRVREMRVAPGRDPGVAVAARERVGAPSPTLRGRPVLLRQIDFQAEANAEAVAKCVSQGGKLGQETASRQWLCVIPRHTSEQAIGIREEGINREPIRNPD